MHTYCTKCSPDVEIPPVLLSACTVAQRCNKRWKKSGIFIKESEWKCYETKAFKFVLFSPLTVCLDRVKINLKN